MSNQISTIMYDTLNGIWTNNNHLEIKLILFNIDVNTSHTPIYSYTWRMNETFFTELSFQTVISDADSWHIWNCGKSVVMRIYWALASSNNIFWLAFRVSYVEFISRPRSRGSLNPSIKGGFGSRLLVLITKYLGLGIRRGITRQEVITTTLMILFWITRHP